ncbi:MAG: PIN domain-containing protein [Puniceicoccaceae bacterium]|nr:MAG: PIN domain-containing protein [Puniceicoccaceae bacterium]
MKRRICVVPGYLVDTNVWIAFNFERHPHNAQAVEFIQGCSAKSPALFSRAVENSTLRLMSNPSVCLAYNSPPMTNQQAVTVLNDWQSHDHIDCLDAEPKDTRALWLELASIPSASPKVWMDAYLAAFAIRANQPYATLDSDFRRFETNGLQLWLLPA